MYNSSASPTLRNVVFRDNTAGRDGGGLFGSLSSATLTNVEFTRNEAGNWGGGFADVLPANTPAPVPTPLLVNVVFRDNSAKASYPGYGGAIHTRYGPITVHGGVFQGNSAYRGGAVAAGWAGIVTLTNVTINGNTATASTSEGGNGGAVYIWKTTAQIYNSILWGNTKAGVVWSSRE